MPGKVVAPLAGVPAIVRMLERVRRISRASRCIVATSEEESDDQLAALCGANGVAVSRGPLDDVLARFAAAVPRDCDAVVRLTGDCPLVDPQLVDRHIEQFGEQPFRAYVSNAVWRTYPDGLDVEVMSRELLMEAAEGADAPYDREHVTPWIQRHARHVPIVQDVDLSAVRWVLDTPDDYEAIAAIYTHLHPARPDFDAPDIYRLQIERPELLRIAGQLTRDEALTRMRLMVERKVPS